MFSQSLKPPVIETPVIETPVIETPVIETEYDDLMHHTINALHFARHGQTIEGEAPMSGFSRLLDGLPKDQGGSVIWRLQGRRDALGRLFLDVQADGTIVLECQRCLQALIWPLSVRNELRMLASRSEVEAMDAREAQGEADDEEYILASASLDAIDVVEDELILALPYVPRHEVCPDQVEPEPGTESRGPSPFAALGRFKKN
ncbi:MAG: YceD family protein [Alcaligenaceae bacterium]|nr:YceD family protein [Alcaligenaceae bacterium]